MIGFGLSEAKGLFFDSREVQDATTRAERKVLSRFGAFVRTRSRSSIRKRKAPAPAGSPPSSHTGLLKRNIFFVFDPTWHSVVIGPIRLNGKRGSAPEALEHGGTSVAVVGAKEHRQPERIEIEARPYMGPAFEAELPGVPSLWANVIS